MPNTQYTEQIINQYLFDDDIKPTDLADVSLIRAKDAFGAPVEITANWYMTQGPGRFAHASLSPLVQAFFERDGSGNYVYQIPGQLAPYFKSDLVNDLGTGIIPIDEIQFSFQQYEYDDGNDNFGERVFIWGTSGFTLSDEARFIVDPTTGERKILNLSIVTPHTVNNSIPEDNFDFEGGSLANISAEYSQDRMDTSRIGRTVEFDFTGQWPTVAEYSETNWTILLTGELLVFARFVDFLLHR